MDADLVDALVKLGAGLVTLLTLLIGWGINTARQKIKNDYARGVLDRTRDAVTQAVLGVQQSFVDGIKDANGDGKISASEAAAAARLAKARALKYLGKDGLKELAKIVGGSMVDGLLGNEIEAQLAKVKATAPKKLPS